MIGNSYLKMGWIGGYQPGNMDNVAVWNRVLSSDEILSMYTSFPASTPFTTITSTDQLDSSNWTDINSASGSEVLDDANAWYSFSFDGRDEFNIWTGSAWRTIASNKNATTGLTE